MNKVVVIQQVRLSSARLPKKVLAEVGGERLIDRGFRLLRQAQDATGVPVVVAAWIGEPELVEAAARHGLAWEPISEANSKAYDWVDLWAGWVDNLSHHDWALHANVVCHPFLRLETLVDMIHRAQAAIWPWVSVTSERGLAWDGAGRALIEATENLSTLTAPWLLRPSHLGSTASIQDMREEVRVKHYRPEVIATQKIELLDIDTADDLRLAQLVATGLGSRVAIK